MSLLNFSFIMIYTIHKILLLIKNYLNYDKDNVFEEIYLKKKFFFITCNDGKFKGRRRKNN